MAFTQEMFVNPNIYSSAALETVALVTGGANLANGARLLGFVANNNSASAAYVQVFDKSSAPSGGAVPLLVVNIAATSQQSVDCNCLNCLPVVNGIVIALSSTLATYTQVATQLFVTAAWIQPGNN